MKVTVWHEFDGFQKSEEVLSVYPEGMHITIKNFLEKETDIDASCAIITQPEHGLTEEVLENTDVLIWWGHHMHNDVSDEIANRVVKHIHRGMGAIFLHSAHFSKPFLKLMGTSCTLKWREAEERERLWVINPSHPIAKGLNDCIVIPKEEMYGEYFDVPQPDEVVFIGWFKGGNVFRSGCTYKRGRGKVFYFQPGHETYPVYYQKEIQQILINAVRWAKPDIRVKKVECENSAIPLEELN